MKLSTRSIDQLRAWHHAADRLAGDDAIDAAIGAGLLAHQVPAWTEGPIGILDRLITAQLGRRSRFGDGDPVSTDTAWRDTGRLLVLLGVRRLLGPGPDWSGPFELLDARGIGHSWTHDTLAARAAAETSDRDRLDLADLGLRLLAASPDEPAGATDADRLVASGPIGACPQIVGVDPSVLVLSRAEWERGALYLALDPTEPDPDRWTMFRLVGAEPRQWDLEAPNGTTTESMVAGLWVRTPRIASTLSFTPGSY